MREQRKTGGFFRVFVVFLTSFLLGFICSNFLINRGLVDKFVEESQKVFNNEESQSWALSMTTFWEAFDIIKTSYYSYNSLKKEDLENGLIKGLVESLDDKHSEFMDSKEKGQFEDMLAWDFEGIGAVVEKHELGVSVDRVIGASPAKKAGILAKDILVKANGEELKDLDLYDAVDKIRWVAGTEVILTVLREGEQDLLEIKVLREKINIPSVEVKEVEGENITHIIVNLFGDNTTVEFKKALLDAKTKDVDGIIIDLRDNGGGYLQSAIEILSEFIPGDEVLVETKYRNPLENTTYYSLNEGEVFEKKIVVLVNTNSASASEITAGALREYDRAIIVGEKTYGKGSVQEPFDLPNGGLLKLTIAHWYTPKGKSIEHEGITPDVEVKFQKEDYVAKYDRQLEEAKKVLKEFVKTEVLQLSVDNYKASLWK